LETDELTLDEWLASTAERREELISYSKSELPKDAGERHTDIEKAIQNASDAGSLLADAEGFLAHATAKAVLEIRRIHDDLDANERKALVKDAVRDVQRLVDGIAVTHRAIQSRIFANMNAGRTRL